MLFYVPLEHIEMRYTTHMDEDICSYLDQKEPYHKIYPAIPPAGKLPEGMFLDAPYTCKFKSIQLAKIAEMFEQDVIKDGDTIWFSDIWFPGIEQIAYMKYFCNKPNVKIKGFLHAGSFTDTDFVRDLERWAKNFEDIIFDIADEIFVASEFIKNDVIKKRIVDPNKLTVTGLPLDFKGLNGHRPKRGIKKKNTVIFNGRNCDEKQPWLFEKLQEMLSKEFPDVAFTNTQNLGLSRSAYYKLLGEAKVVVSYALQENFGFGIAEAAYLGCVPVVPNRLVYPELYGEKYLYETFEESVDKVREALNNNIAPLGKEDFKFSKSCFSKWFK